MTATEIIINLPTEEDMENARRAFHRLWHDFNNNGLGNWDNIEDSRFTVFAVLEKLNVPLRKRAWLIREKAPREANWTRPMNHKWFETRKDIKKRWSKRIHESDRFAGRLHELGVILDFRGWKKWGFLWALENRDVR